jgi:hypothetical protein
MEVELSTDETVRALRVQTLLWTEVSLMRCLYYTEWCECPDCEMHRLEVETIYDEDGMRVQGEDA